MVINGAVGFFTASLSLEPKTFKINFGKTDLKVVISTQFRKGHLSFFWAEVRIAGHVFRKYNLHLLKHSTCQEKPFPKMKKIFEPSTFSCRYHLHNSSIFFPRSILNPPFLACGTSSSTGTTGSGSGAADSSGATGSSSATGSGSGATSTRSPATSRVKGSLKKSPQSNGNRQTTTHPQKKRGITLW